MVSPQLATSMRMALPKQLADVLGDLAPTVSEFSELAPGIPASKEVLADMFHQLKRTDIHVEHKTTTGFAVRSSILRTFKKREVTGLVVHVVCFSGVNDAGPVNFRREMGSITAFKEFDFTIVDMKAAMDFMAEESNYAKRRGLCSDCLADTPPKKRLRIVGTSVCAHCVLVKKCS